MDLGALSSTAIGQTPLHRRRQKFIKTCKLWSLYTFGKKKFVLLRRVSVSINIMDQLLLTRQTHGEAKSHKKSCHIPNSRVRTTMSKIGRFLHNQLNTSSCILEGIVLWLLVFSMKAQRTNFCSSPIKLLESFVFSTTLPLPFNVNHSIRIL